MMTKRVLAINSGSRYTPWSSNLPAMIPGRNSKEYCRYGGLSRRTLNRGEIYLY
jgi:hypothetical protein